MEGPRIILTIYSLTKLNWALCQCGDEHVKLAVSFLRPSQTRQEWV